MNKDKQFWAWLLGESKEFPFFQNFQEVPMPDMRTVAERNGEYLNPSEELPPKDKDGIDTPKY